jgi:2-acylglycerol O-acyltransferase 2
MQKQGFVRVALQAGVSVVPVLHFGENELYEQVENYPGTWVRFIQVPNRTDNLSSTHS